jgi:hypothetical protein
MTLLLIAANIKDGFSDRTLVCPSFAFSSPELLVVVWTVAVWGGCPVAVQWDALLRVLSANFYTLSPSPGP